MARARGSWHGASSPGVLLTPQAAEPEDPKRTRIQTSRIASWLLRLGWVRSLALSRLGLSCPHARFSALPRLVLAPAAALCERALLLRGLSGRLRAWTADEVPRGLGCWSTRSTRLPTATSGAQRGRLPRGALVDVALASDWQLNAPSRLQQFAPAGRAPLRAQAGPQAPVDICPGDHLAPLAANLAFFSGARQDAAPLAPRPRRAWPSSRLGLTCLELAASVARRAVESSSALRALYNAQRCVLRAGYNATAAALPAPSLREPGVAVAALALNGQRLDTGAVAAQPLRSRSRARGPGFEGLCLRTQRLVDWFAFRALRRHGAGFDGARRDEPLQGLWLRWLSHGWPGNRRPTCSQA
jgi:hypothetical protein